MVLTSAIEPYKHRPCGRYGCVAGHCPYWATAVRANEIDVAVTIDVAVREALAVLMECRIHALLDWVEVRVVGIEYRVVDADDVQQMGTYGDVLENSSPISSQHAPSTHYEVSTLTLPAGVLRTQPVEVLGSIILVVEEGCSIRAFPS